MLGRDAPVQRVNFILNVIEIFEIVLDSHPAQAGS